LPLYIKLALETPFDARRGAGSDDELGVAADAISGVDGWLA
jgi:hypothetical protein